MGQGKLKDEVNSYLTNGELVPTVTIEKLIDQAFKKRSKDILMIGYPLTVDQFQSFKMFVAREKLLMSNIWLFKVNHFEDFMEKRFREDDVKKWAAKFGDEMRKTWTKKHDEFEMRMRELIDLDDHAWTTIGLDYSERNDVNLIVSGIKNCTQQRI